MHERWTERHASTAITLLVAALIALAVEQLVSHVSDALQTTLR